MEELFALRPGRYRHFKGNEYELLYVARHSETLEPMVVYRALYGERGVWVHSFKTIKSQKGILLGAY